MQDLFHKKDLFHYTRNQQILCKRKGKGAFSLVKSPLLPPLGGNSPEKYASQDQVFRPLRRAAKGSAFGNRDFLKKIE